MLLESVYLSYISNIKRLRNRNFIIIAGIQVSKSIACIWEYVFLYLINFIIINIFQVMRFKIFFIPPPI